MAQPVLPDSLREKIAGLFEDGRSSVEIFDAVFDEATPYVDSHEQLTMCIAALKGKIPPGKTVEQKAAGEIRRRLVNHLPALQPFEPGHHDAISGHYVR